jgi:hypothetical protein
MRSRLVMASIAVLIAALGALFSGCANTLESRDDRVVVAVDEKSSEPATQVTEGPPVIGTEPAARRPRLSRTVTLGEATAEPVYVAAPSTQSEGQSGSNVVVNNNITVVGSPPVVYGGYSGAYSSTFNSGVGYGMRDASGRGSGSRSAWAPSGREGAGRTAAPGQTLHVGGNWAPAPSYGPREFK